MCMLHNMVLLPIFAETAVGYDGPHQREEVAEHDEGMVDGSGTVVTELQLVSEE